MKDLSGTGGIPMPIKGYKLVITTPIDYEGEYHSSALLTWWEHQQQGFLLDSNPKNDWPENLKWQLFPILDSGVWISGEMPLPEPNEGTLLMLQYPNNEIIIAKAGINGWVIPFYREFDSFYALITNQMRYKNLTQWQWISAPK